MVKVDHFKSEVGIAGLGGPFNSQAAHAAQEKSVAGRHIYHFHHFTQFAL